MPFHVYSLKLELYPNPPSTSVNHHDQVPFVPAHETDIFSTSLPTHSLTKWSSGAPPRAHSRQPSRGSTPENLSQSRPGSAGLHESHGNALLLPERNTALKEQVSPAWPSQKPSSNTAAKDWRFGPISIDSIDMDLADGGGRSGAKNAAANKAVGGLHTRGLYTPTDAKTTDVGWGVVHLYKDTQEGAGVDQERQLERVRKSRRAEAGEGSFDVEQCTTLCILAVPSWMMPSDLLGFVGDQTRDSVSHFRLIRTGRANKYMVLMKFRQASKAREWYKDWNGRLFSAMEPENCHVVYIKSVEFLTPESSMLDSSTFPQNTHDPFTASGKTSLTPSLPSSIKPYAPPTPSLIELPTCPVCLERMDETTGLLTILCQHVFHCACLEKWRGSGCPVCRYTQSPSFTFPYPRPDANGDSGNEADANEPACSVCASSSNLWICLICGNIGCGRYDSAHAFAHYEATSHCYAMDISNQHVWDYAGDGYVHRLIQNKDAIGTNNNSSLGSSNKYATIDLPGATHPNAAFRAEAQDSVPREKMEAMANEYTYLLTSQLEGQRRYFEEQLERAVDKASSASTRAEEAAAKAVSAATQLESLELRSQTQHAEVSRLEKAVSKAEARAARFESMARDMSKSAREEKAFSEGLLGRIKAVEAREVEKNEMLKKIEEDKQKLQEEKGELEEMNRDLSIFISSQEKIKELQAQGEEVEMGSVGVAESKGKGRRKGKKG